MNVTKYIKWIIPLMVLVGCEKEPTAPRTHDHELIRTNTFPMWFSAGAEQGTEPNTFRARFYFYIYQDQVGDYDVTFNAYLINIDDGTVVYQGSVSAVSEYEEMMYGEFYSDNLDPELVNSLYPLASVDYTNSE